MLRGSAEQVAAEAARQLPLGAEVLWVREGADPTRAALGCGVDAVVLLLHDGFDADRLARAQGFIREGGALFLGLPEVEAPPAPQLALEGPHATTSHRLWSRIAATLPPAGAPEAPIAPEALRAGSEGQARAIEDLWRALSGASPQTPVLLAERGRGKSAALGLVAARLLEAGTRVVLTGPDETATAEVRAFAAALPHTPLPVALQGGEAGVVLVDEAARLPVPTLRALRAAWPGARFAWATTVSGYEGTGRGFVLRFLAGLEAQGEPVLRLSWEEPARWRAGDPLEAWTRRALLLDADLPLAPRGGSVTVRALDRDALVADEALLRGVFGLLVHAHYRTSPSDLHRLLDAPNMTVHAIFEGDDLAGVCLVAREGGLAAEVAEQVASGQRRLRGHALPDTLAVHAQRPEAATWRWVRSVRIAVHPARREAGLGRALADAVHAAYAPDGFGTLFGAIPELLRFRLKQGYVPVRLAAGWGERSGEPSVVMLRPVSARCEALARELREILAWNLPWQLAALAAEAPLDPELATALTDALPASRPPTEAAVARALAGYLRGPAPFESALFALRSAWEARHAGLDRLPPADRALIEAKLGAQRSWREAAAAGGHATVPGAQRAVRRALRTWLESGA